MKDGGPAFPVRQLGESDFRDGCSQTVLSGMSLRDYFAGQALIGLVANHETLKKGTSWVVNHAFNAADAMLAAREQSQIANRKSEIPDDPSSSDTSTHD